MGDGSDEAHAIAVFIDLENVAIGVRDARFKSFDIDLVLKRLVDKGNVVVKKAYADWTRYADYKRPLHEAGVELLEMPGSKLTGKNECPGAWTLDSPPRDVKFKSQKCTDGAACDFDVTPGQCRFRVGV